MNNPICIICLLSSIFSAIAWLMILFSRDNFIFAIVPILVGIILGVVGIRKARRSQLSIRGKSWAVLGLLLGLLAFIGLAIVVFTRWTF